MQDWNLADQRAGLENTGLENGGLEMQDWKMQDKMTVEPKASKNVRKSDTNSYRPEMLLGLSENFVIKTSYR